jgi:hypothetical protein
MSTGKVTARYQASFPKVQGEANKTYPNAPAGMENPIGMKVPLPMTVPLPTPIVPVKCRACGASLLMINLYEDDGCKCNCSWGTNFPPRMCSICGVVCVKPGHHLSILFGSAVR